MKVTNKTAYATIGCDVQLSENDRLALGIELDKITNWLETVIGDKAVTEDPYKAINNLAAFVSKFAICPSLTNVFTDDSVEEFKKADETVDTEQSEDYFKLWITVIPEEQSKELRNAKEYNVNFIVAKAMEVSKPHLSSEEIHNYILGNLADEGRISWEIKTNEDFKHAVEILDKYGVKYKTGGIFVPSQMVEALKSKGSKALRSEKFDKAEHNDHK